MEGVTILSINTYTIPLWIIIFLAGGITVIAAITLAFSWRTIRNGPMQNSTVIPCILSAVTICVIAGLMIIWTTLFANDNRTSTEYTVSVDSSVDFDEFKEKYIIIAEHDDGTFTVKERID